MTDRTAAAAASRERQEADDLAACAARHRLDADALAGLVAAARREATHRRRRMPSPDLEAHVRAAAGTPA